MIRRMTAAALCIGVLGGAAATAEAAFKAGIYKGKTEQNAKISLKVLSSKKAVVKFNWEGAAFACSNGQNGQVPGFQTDKTVKIKLKKNGKFTFSARNADRTLEFATAGRIKGSKAVGALQVQLRINEEGQLDPNGSVTCDSEIVEWSAKRKK